MRKVFHGWKLFRQGHQQELLAREEDSSRECFISLQVRWR
jgi:hypothetical protein